MLYACIQEKIELKMKIAALSAAIIKKLLDTSNCSQHYRVEISLDGLIVRESTQHPPSKEEKSVLRSC